MIDLIIIGKNNIKSTYPNNTYMEIKINSEKIKIFRTSSFTDIEEMKLDKNKIVEIKLEIR